MGEQVGDFCRQNKDHLKGCSGEGRPSCKAAECLYGAMPCPKCKGFKPEGAACNWCGYIGIVRGE